MATGKVDAGIFSLRYSYSCYRHVLQVISQRKLYARTTYHLFVKAGADPGGGPGGPGPPLTTKNEAPAPKFFKTEAPEWQF